MKYAVIQTGGKQYKVSEGDTILVEKLSNANGRFTTTDILLINSDGDVQIGKPFVNGISVSGTILGEVKGTKIRVSNFKAKARYRRVTGHRQKFSQVKIEAIGSEKKEAKSEEIVKEEKKSTPPVKRTRSTKAQEK